MKIAYHMPSLQNIYAQRTIYFGFKNAFEDLGHSFFTFTADDNLEEFLEQNQPDIFITASHFYYQKFLDLTVLKRYRRKGLVLFVKTEFWNRASKELRSSESTPMGEDKKTVKLIKDGLMGDIFFHVVEQEDKRMEGFEQGTGLKFETIPLAADKTIMKHDYSDQFKADISFLGTYSPAKKEYFDELVFPLLKRYDLKLFGQDWTAKDRFLGKIQKAGQLFNIPLLRSIQKPKLKLTDEAKIYSSAVVSINVHENHQREFGGDCNERTFKVPLCGGFEITDDVACIRKYLKEGEEIVIAKNTADWFEKIDYYIKHPEKREPIIRAGQKKVLQNHTYHNRANQIIELSREFKQE